VLDQVKLELLKQTVERDDWIEAGDVCLELSLAAKGTPDEFYAKALASAVRLRDVDWLKSIVGELTRLAAE